MSDEPFFFPTQHLCLLEPEFSGVRFRVPTWKGDVATNQLNRSSFWLVGWLARSGYNHTLILSLPPNQHCHNWRSKGSSCRRTFSAPGLWGGTEACRAPRHSRRLHPCPGPMQWYSWSVCIPETAVIHPATDLSSAPYRQSAWGSIKSLTEANGLILLLLPCYFFLSIKETVLLRHGLTWPVT